MATQEHFKLLAYGYMSDYLPDRSTDTEIIYETVAAYSTRKSISIGLVGDRNSGKSTLGGYMTFSRYSAISSSDAGHVTSQGTEWASYFDEDDYENTVKMSVHGNMHEMYTDSYHISLIDTPGHRRYLKNFIRYIAHCDAVILVFAADHLQGKHGFDSSKSPKMDQFTFDGYFELLDKLRICRLFDISQLIVAVNKMDIYQYSKLKYMECTKFIHKLLMEAGYLKTRQIPIIPISAVCGENILIRSTNEKLKWWRDSEQNGICVYDAMEWIDYKQLVMYNRDNIVVKPFKFAINNFYEETLKGTVISGRIENGHISVGNAVRCYPSGCQGQVESIEIFGKQCQSASYGNIVGLRINEFMLSPQRGDIIVNGNNTTEFDVSLFEVLLTVYPSSVKLGREYSIGFSPIVYTNSCTRCQCKIKCILWKTGRTQQKDEDPEYIQQGDTAKVLFEPSQQFAVIEGQKVAIVEHREVIMMGKVTRLGEEQEVITM